MGIVGKGIVSQKTPKHGAEEKQKKTDDTGQYKEYWSGIGPHLFDLRDKAHQGTATETDVTDEKLLGVGIGVDRRDGHKPAGNDGTAKCNGDRPLESRPVSNGEDSRSHSGTSSQEI